MIEKRAKKVGQKSEKRESQVATSSWKKVASQGTSKQENGSTAIGIFKDNRD